MNRVEIVRSTGLVNDQFYDDIRNVSAQMKRAYPESDVVISDAGVDPEGKAFAVLTLCGGM